MTTLIMPCGGKSSRFPNMRPKYMLTHPDGRLMIEHAMRGLNPDSFERRIITIIRRHDEEYEAGLWLSQAFAGRAEVEICVLDDFTASASETVALTVERMGIKGGAVIKDCDNFVSVSIPNPLTNSVTGYDLRRNPDLANVPGKSFLLVNEQNIIQDIIEKKIVSETICVGVYALADIEDFIAAYHEILAKNVRSELFISHVISYMINRRQAIFEALNAGEYQDWGTAREWENIRRAGRTYFIDLDGVIFKNSGRYGKTNWSDKAVPLGKNLAAIKKLQERGGQIVITTSRPENCRPALEKTLAEAGLRPYAILTGLNHAARVLINDFAPTNPYPSALAISMPRDGDISDYTD